MPSLLAPLCNGRWHKVTGAVLLPLVIGACSQRDAGGGAGGDACSGGENLLRDIRFESLTLPRAQRQWLSSQHSSDVSFAYAADEGVLTITHTGDEPWFMLGQSITGTEWAGKRVRFSADLKLALTPPVPDHSFRKGGGLMLRARKGGRVVLSSEFEHQPHMGEHNWQRVSVTRDIPAQADRLRVGFQHQAGGELQARNPDLRIVPAGCS